ncbi:hypothetical protein DLJ46_13985 [Micromonospora globispora]|uniref:Uncharacterized protein n=1 Tax=Micromonospora globispora TaxID=1450148 RepID=A0A317K505_9ACTN|nr:hypothetical protein DLJ46_13985 [Micromonospora globispora]RQW82867.1 hypothetical protein DKL51_32705 [Micromonospora globispora]
MAATAAGAFRRTAIERSDQRVAWERTDQAFFAAGACHILAWVCRDSYPDRPIEIAAVRLAGERQVFHAYTVWDGWAFDHSGWNPEPELLAINTDFEGQPLQRVKIIHSLAEFCETHHHRMPDQYWHDPLPRARDYVGRYSPPWARRLQADVVRVAPA